MSLARLGVDKQGERREIKARVLKIFATWKKTNPGGHTGHNKDPTFTSSVVLEGKKEEGRVDKVLKESMTGNF